MLDGLGDFPRESTRIYTNRDEFFGNGQSEGVVRFCWGVGCWVVKGRVGYSSFFKMVPGLDIVGEAGAALAGFFGFVVQGF